MIGSLVNRTARLALLSAACLSCSLETSETPRSAVEVPTLGERWLVINYWASWCAPCREEIPELNRLARQRSDIAVYAVNFDSLRGPALTEAAAEMGIEFSLLAADPAPLLATESPTVLPTTLIVSPAGKVATRLLGPQTNAGLLLEIGRARALAANEE